MKADLEWLVGVIRVGDKFDRHGDPYEFAVTVVRDGDSVKLVAGSGKFTREMRRAIINMFKGLGIKKVVWSRVKTGDKELNLD